MNESKRGGRKKTLWTVLFVLINIAVVAATAVNEFTGKETGPAQLVFSPYAAVYLLCTALCLAVLLTAEAMKYYLMMKSVGEPASFRIAFETAALGKYYDCITPSGAGGQPFQILWLHRHGYSSGASSALPIAGYITMQAGFIMLALITFVAERSVDLEAVRYTAYSGLVLFSAIPILLVLFSFMPRRVEKIISGAIRFLGRLKLVKDTEKTTEKVIGMLDSYHSSFSVISRDRKMLLCLLFLSLIYRIALCSMPFFVLKMFGASVSFWHVFASTVYIYASVALVPTPGNAGAAEGAFYLVFSVTGTGGVFWAMLVWRIFSFYAFIITGAAIYGINALQKRSGKKEEGA